MPPVLRRVISSWLRLRAPGIDFSPTLRSWRMTGEEAARSSALASVVSPRFVSEIVAAFENGRSALVASVRPGAALPEVDGDRRGLLGEAPQLDHRALELAERVRELVEAGDDVVAALGRCGAGGGGVADEAGEMLALLGQRLQDRVAVLGELGELLVLLGEGGEDLVGLLERGVGATNHGREVGAAGGETGAEVVEDQPEALDLGLTGDVVDEVEVDLLAVVLDRQPVLAGADLAVGDLLERRRRLRLRGPWLGRLALDVLLAEQRLRPDQAGGVGEEVLEAGIVDAEHRDGLAGLLVAVAPDGLARQRDRDLVDGADRGAGDPHLLAVDEEAGVVEVGADLVVPAVVALAGCGCGDQRRDERRGR